ncbi:hypothetical protein [Actinoplanes sp. NBRC 103695]|uniref:CysS/YqeB C-terminal domain-containing protein n=1 Tax=Actinoplanes sp. NBRC 103695 TaxID=3032202 RepID=UPI0024A233FB|nr:hypothetical protein [Actinoplanes sp. NBRC 103695]GLZ01596.1 hypothetical protein Acsp02_88470 [Actinoplanes sp. NBRC 103695]
MAGLLAIMGSGETSPTMVTIHQRIAALLPPGPSAVLLETPYGFQENARDISTRACQYFDRSVGLKVAVAPEDGDHGLAMVRGADWLFSGPGSPTYAMRCWRGAPTAQALHDRINAFTSITVFASAAAATLGAWSVPVYELYKAGYDPHWADGLDVLQRLGLRVALIPHYDNTEGGTRFDTRYCYLGERRLRIMERLLPDDAAVLGVDEHTCVLVDRDADTVRVIGRGGLTVRRDGHSTVLASGTELTLTELRALAHGVPIDRVLPPPRPTGQAEAPAPSATITETAADCERRFDEALAGRNAEAMATAILDLEESVRAWATDTEEDDGMDQARAVLRTLIVRLSQAATPGLTDPAERWKPLIKPLLGVRDQLRDRRDWAAADAIRDALAAAGVDVRDEPGATSYSVK